MNGRTAKKIRREVYGDFSPRARQRYINPENGQILADERRARYQRVKKLYTLRKAE